MLKQINEQMMIQDYNNQKVNKNRIIFPVLFHCVLAE